MTQDEKKSHAREFLGHCLAGDVAHATVLSTLIESGFTTHEDLGITPDDMKTFRALSGIASPKERAKVAFRGCREGSVLACFGVVRHLIHTKQITPGDLLDDKAGMLTVGSHLSRFSKEHTAHLARILPPEEPTQD